MRAGHQPCRGVMANTRHRDHEFDSEHVAAIDGADPHLCRYGRIGRDRDLVEPSTSLIALRKQAA